MELQNKQITKQSWKLKLKWSQNKVRDGLGMTTECRMGMKPEAITKVGNDHRMKLGTDLEWSLKKSQNAEWEWSQKQSQR